MWSYLSPHGKLRLEQHARSMVDAAALAHRIEWAVMYGDADAGTHIDAASPAPAQPRRRVICAATRVPAHKGIGRGAADAAKRIESFAPPAKLRSEENTYELQSPMRKSYGAYCRKKKQQRI